MLFCGLGSAGLLVHCISGWDRTPLFVSLLRLSLWADGEAHKSLKPLEILYLTLAYDWFLFGWVYCAKHCCWNSFFICTIKKFMILNKNYDSIGIIYLTDWVNERRSAYFYEFTAICCAKKMFVFDLKFVFYQILFFCFDVLKYITTDDYTFRKGRHRTRKMSEMDPILDDLLIGQ